MGIALVVVSCSDRNEEVNPTPKSRYNMSALTGTAYDALLGNDMEVFGRYWYQDMHLFQDTVDDFRYAQHNSPNTYSLSGRSAKLKIADSCRINNDGVITEFNVNRTVGLNGGNGVLFSYYSKSENLDPIAWIRPYATRCDPTPLCYYKDMEIEWNADPKNKNGVVVVAEWQGTTVSSNPKRVHIVTGDIVEDNGKTVLRNELFDDIPDEALVNLWLVRANINIVERKDESELFEKLVNEMKVADYEEKQMNEALEIIKNKDLPILVNGSVALLPIILIRTLP